MKIVLNVIICQRLLLVFSLVLTVGCNSYFLKEKHSNFVEISDNILNYHLKMDWKDPVYHSDDKVNSELIFKTGKIDFVEKCDTFFILEQSDIESGTFYYQIWDKRGNSVQYSCRFKELSFPNDGPLFSNYMVSLVTNWDLAEIKKEEMEHPLGGRIFATRVIRKNPGFSFECIYFEEFFDLERDRWIF
ncbi:MAG: hypothetical protein LCH54_09280 [Bacteroidetes bacterium]|nr:hypothetical protein [Bacteroidota bacterium]